MMKRSLGELVVSELKKLGLDIEYLQCKFKLDQYGVIFN